MACGPALELPPGAPRWLGELLIQAARREAPAGMLFHDAEGVETFVTYAQLLASAQRIAGGLRAAGVEPGANVVFHFRGNRDFFEAFWACMLARMIPVPTPAAASYVDASGNVRRLADACSMLGGPFVATSEDLANEVLGALRSLGAEARVLTVEALRQAAPYVPDAIAAGDDVALMMLTSGSTGRPKGVPLSHRNLIARSVASARANRLDVDSVSLNWMPLDHVAGLILSHMRDMVVACRQVHVATEWVLRDPLLWIDLLDRHRVTATFAPNFAYGLVCARGEEIARRSWDLSCVRRIVNGGEAVVAASARRFLQLLAPHGLPGDAMVPAWGMSETSSGVTYSDDFRLDTVADADPYVPVGRPIAGVKLRIVDDSDCPLVEGEIGHLQVAGETVFAGYFGDRPPREEAFTRDGWFRTGDLARIDGGVLSITGRAKDVIIVNGANYSGPAIEEAVDGLPGVARSFTAACGVPDPHAHGGEGLAIFFVPEDDRDEPLATTLRAIRQRIVQEFGLGIAFLVPLDRSQVEKTSIGKIQRTALQKALIAGRYEDALRRVDLLTGNANVLPAWFFRRRWVPKAIAGRHADGRERGVIVVQARGPLGAAVARALARRNLRMVPFEPGVTLDARDRDMRLVLDLGNSARGDVVGRDETARAARACARLAGIVSSLQQLRGPFCLNVVSNGVANLTGEEDADLARGTVPAVVRSIAGEYERTRARHMDCGDMPPDAAAEAIVAEMLADPPDVEVAYRGRKRFVPALEHFQPAANPDANGPLVRGGRYVVTGGLGGVGFELSTYLLREWNAHVAIVGRSEPSAALEQLQQLSPRVQYVRADVSDAAALRAGLGPVISSWGSRLDAAFHAAAEFHESSLGAETEATFDRMLRAKVAGAQALLELLREHEGAALVAFSSIVGVFGGAQVGAYAAASRYLDDLATVRGGTPVYTIDWTAWRDTGLNRRYAAFEPLRAMGGMELSVEHALASLQVSLGQPPGQILVGLDRTNAHIARQAPSCPFACSIDVFYEAGPQPGSRPELALLEDRFGTPCRVTATPLPELPLALDGHMDLAALERMAEHGSTPGSPRTETEQVVWELWRRVLGIETIGIEDSFFELGGQSLHATQLLSAISDRFGVRWSLRDIFATTTIAAQARRIDSATMAQGPASAAAAQEPGESDHRALPLAPGQQRLWFLDRVHPHNTAYHISAIVRFEACPDAELVRTCVQALSDRHESLRTRFPLVDGEPRQWIEARMPVPLPVEELADDTALEALQEAEVRRGFDLAEGPLWRVRLARLPGGRGALLLALHHSIADGWSMKVIFRELLALLGSRGAARLPALARQYSDFAAELDASLRAGRLQGQVDYWRRQLEGNLHGFSLPTDFPRPAVQTYPGARLSVRLSPDLARRTRTLARKRGVTLFVTLLAAFNAMLARYTQQHDIVVGSAFANRSRTDLEPIVGFVVNVLAMRANLDGDPRFADILQRVQRVVLDAHAHADVPFESLVDLLQPPRDTSRPPLFQIVFDMRDPEITRSRLDGVTLGVMEPDLGASQYDLNVSFSEDETGLTAIWHYNTDLFRRETVERMAANYLTLLDGAVREPMRRLSRLPLVSAAERELLASWNRTAAPFPRDRCMQHLFEEQVDLRPEAPALWYRGATMSYAELDSRANRLAHRLRALGVQRDSLVGVSLERSPELLVAILGILKAGGAYLPLDPTYPPDRLEYMLRDSGARLLLTRAAFAPIFETPTSNGPAVLALERLDVSADPDTRLHLGAPGDLAYVIYTSGSTGRPKGVQVEHHGWCNVAQANHDAFALRPGMRVLQFASLSFDASALEISMALPIGGTLVLGEPHQLLPGAALAGLLREARVNAVMMTPSSMATLEGDFPDLRVITVGGEACPASLVERWARPPVRFFNLYGPTETTILASWTECHAGANEAPPIGRPIPNMQLHVLDAHGDLLPVGMPGELYIGGEGVTRGYRGRPELQAERFVPDPFSEREDSRLYRSGDLVRRRGDGQIEFLGRVDQQVKIRGFRIELGEIDAVLRTHPGVQEAVVTTRTGKDGEAALVAYVCPPPGSEAPTVAELRRHLQASLPQFMLPARMVVLERMPLLPNGKVDRAALPHPDVAVAAPGEAGMPQNEMERIVAGVWCEVLGVSAVDRRQNFFEAGGHSLKMTRVHALLSRRLGRELPLVDLFRNPTVASLAAYLSPAAPAQAGAGMAIVVP
ncbi:MAG TPA: amino acid adenylation domain-containing protein [Usitatibacter sp.]|nr:amino acid adenylation domain-containing protein [Usitatibacter sp.]